MKYFICFVLLVSLAVAEPPRYRFERQRFERQELADGDKEPTTQRNDGAPYPPAGWRPTKEFNLPNRVPTQPISSYGVPSDSYGAPINTFPSPSNQYGAPNADSTKNNTENQQKDTDDDKKENLTSNSDAELVSTGAYYVLLPNSQLQRVQFRTENDPANMAYTARLQYRNEDRAPIFVYAAVPQYPNAAYVQLV